MREIQLNTKRPDCKNYMKYKALVDDEDYESLIRYSWNVFTNNGINLYAMGHVDGKQIFMHRFILNAPPEKIIDHRDANGLNNQKYNIRMCTHEQNQMNKRPYGISKYKGVGRHVIKNSIIDKDKSEPKLISYRWQSYIRINGVLRHLGYFKTEIEAGKAYDEKAKEIHGEFARLNFPDE